MTIKEIREIFCHLSKGFDCVSYVNCAKFLSYLVSIVCFLYQFSSTSPTKIRLHKRASRDLLIRCEGSLATLKLVNELWRYKPMSKQLLFYFDIFRWC